MTKGDPPRARPTSRVNLGSVVGAVVCHPTLDRGEGPHRRPRYSTAAAGGGRCGGVVAGKAASAALAGCGVEFACRAPPQPHLEPPAAERPHGEAAAAARRRVAPIEAPCVAAANVVMGALQCGNGRPPGHHSGDGCGRALGRATMALGQASQSFCPLNGRGGITVVEIRGPRSGLFPRPVPPGDDTRRTPAG